MTTIIHSNGSKWAGQEPDTIDDLLTVLDSHPLDRRFERYGNFIKLGVKQPGVVNFHGNFFSLSHVFNIDSDDPGTVRKLTKAIRANQKRSDYGSQVAV